METTLTLINSVDLDQSRDMLQKITQFQILLKSQLKQDLDFGIIPGTAKPTLLKSGAEKVLMLMGLTSEYDIIEKIMDYERGVFAFTVKCTLLKHGGKITEGLGHCNTREGKYAYRWVYEKEVPVELEKNALVKRKYNGQYGDYFKYRLENDDPYTLVNTCLKMAKKRSQIDAVLTVASLSEIFTQDIEDMDLGGNAVDPKPKETKTKVNQPGVDSMDGLIDPETGEIIGGTPTTPKMGATEAEETGGCDDCGAKVTEKVAKYSRQRFNKCLCYNCQKTA